MNKNIRFIVLIGLQIVAIGFLAIIMVNKKSNVNHEGIFQTVGNKLQAAGLTDASISYYEHLLFNSNLDDLKNAQLALNVANLYEKEGNFKKALGFYYLVETLDSKHSYKDEASKNIVKLLEKLGKSSASKMALQSLSSLNNKKAPKGSKVLAEVGDTKIYDYELGDLLDSLPPDQKKNFKGANKGQLLNKLVADELLYQKAQRLNLKETSAYLKKMNEFEKQLNVQLLLQNEIDKKIKITDKNVAEFYEKQKDKFKRPASNMIGFISLKGKEKANAILKKAKKNKSLKKVSSKNFKEETIYENGTIPGLDKDATNKVFASKDKIVGPILHKGKYYIIDKLKTIAAQIFPFEKVKNHVKDLYKMEETKKIYQEMIKSLMESENVKVYAENIK